MSRLSYISISIYVYLVQTSKALSAQKKYFVWSAPVLKKTDTPSPSTRTWARPNPARITNTVSRHRFLSLHVRVSLSRTSRAKRSFIFCHVQANSTPRKATKCTSASSPSSAPAPPLPLRFPGLPTSKETCPGVQRFGAYKIYTSWSNRCWRVLEDKYKVVGHTTTTTTTSALPDSLLWGASFFGNDFPRMSKGLTLDIC